MVDKRKERDDDSDGEPPEQGGCITCLEWTWWVLKGIFDVIKYLVCGCCDGLAYCWYPTKERYYDCCDRCNKCLNPE